MKKTLKKTTKKSQSPDGRSFFELTDSERDDMVAKYDGPLDESEWRPLTREERALHERMRRRPNIHIHVVDADVTFVQLRPTLLKRLDKFARSHNMTRQQAIEAFVRESLARAS